MTIYKCNDIRGIYGKELKDSDAYKIAQAFSLFTKTKKVVIGRDNRLSSPALHKSLVKGFINSSVDIIDIGIVDSSALYFASHHFNLPAIMITASHNPPKFNGFYLCYKNGESIYSRNGLKKVQRIAEFLSSQKNIQHKNKATLIKKDIFSHYVRHIIQASNINLEKIKPLKIVIDAGNGSGARIAQKLFKQIPQTKIIKLFFNSDGRFPNHGPDTTITKNLRQLINRVKQEKADLGLALDGDADRLALVDEKGNIIHGSILGALLADNILKNSINNKIVYTIGCSKIVQDIISQHKAIGFKERVGHSFVNAKMIKEQALFGIEHTGHYFYKNNFYTESPMITSLILLEILSKSNKTISQLIKKYEKYYMTKEISFPAKDTNIAIEKIQHVIKRKYKKSPDTFDGLFLEFPDYWFRIRPSQTESKIRFVVEGTNKIQVEKTKDELMKIIKNSLI